MKLHQQLQERVRKQGGLAVKVMTFHTIVIVTIVFHLIAFWLSAKGSLFPGSDTLMSIVSTCAQIIAGLYGITVAGFTFFLSRIDALAASDVTLDYVAASVKARFKHLLWGITLNVLTTLFISIFLMYCPVPTEDSHAFFYRLFCNEFVMSLAFSILLILYYSLLVIDPNCLEKEAAKLKKKLSRSFGPAGSAVEFISLYQQIRQKCDALLPAPVLLQLRENKGNRFEFTISLLQEQRLLPQTLVWDLTRIHRYYECAVNCSSMNVSLEMCLLARHVLSYLEQTPPFPGT